MSSFMLTATNKATGKKHEVLCLDDYFGRHQCGYIVKGLEVLTEEQFMQQFYTAGDEK